MPRDLQKKSPGLLDFFSPGTTGPWDLQGLWVLSCSVPSRDLPGTSRDGTVLLESLVHRLIITYKIYLLYYCPVLHTVSLQSYSFLYNQVYNPGW